MAASANSVSPVHTRSVTVMRLRSDMRPNSAHAGHTQRSVQPPPSAAGRNEGIKRAFLILVVDERILIRVEAGKRFVQLRVIAS
jgi:hypothetical protein